QGSSLEMSPVLPIALLVACATAPAPSWKALYSGEYGFTVPAGSVKVLALPIPPKFVGAGRPMSFTWTVIRPIPVPVMIVMEQCNQPDVCVPLIMRATGQGNGTAATTFRVTNRSGRPLDVQFRYTIWEAC
ncbi:MAG: hypothetical protein K6V73_12845, partial [Firmicutes bacterium]|nr:hypothetical protein [Bacillota bacterium]